MRHKQQPAAKRAVVLLSGGLDSAVALYLARAGGFKCSCLIFDYGQRHKREVASAKKIARQAGCDYKLIRLDFPWKGSSLLDKGRKIRRVAMSPCRHVTGKIPDTYVPGRNIIFLSLALSCAEATGARTVFIGAHAQDYSGYPDCRPQFFRAFAKAAHYGTKAGVERRGIKIKTPLIDKTKAGIIRLGKKLGVPFELTWSCYKGGARPCGCCDSCYYRAKGFRRAGLKDPALTDRRGRERA